MKRMLEAILVAVALAVAGCASSPVVFTDFDRAALFANYHTYRWSDEQPGQAAPLMQQRIVEAIDAQLNAKGWSRVAAGDPDVIVSAKVAHRQEYRIDSYYPAWGWGGWGGWGWGGWGCCYGGWGPGWGYAGGWDSSYVRAYVVGTLSVDMFDARTKRAIWSGTAESTVHSDPAKQTADINFAVQKMFAAFPPGSVPVTAQAQ